MAKITTRKPEDTEEDLLLHGLQNLIHDVTAGTIGFSSSAVIEPGDTPEEVLDTLQEVFDVLQGAAQQLFNEVQTLSIMNINLDLKLQTAMEMLDNVTDITYDDALDHATADLMDALSASGVADSTPNGELVFDHRVPISRADLKPILREAIIRWVDLKLK